MVPDRFEWSAGQWSYKPVKNAPFEMQERDLQGNQNALRRIEYNQAETMLGAVLAPDGGTYQQTKAMLHLANQWADGVITGNVKRDEAWLAITSVIMKTMSYPLPILNLLKQQCEAIIASILTYGLLQLVYAETFPENWSLLWWSI